MHRRESFWQVLWVVEATLVGWFFIQSLRMLLGTLYAHVSSADIVLRLGMPDESVQSVLPSVAQAEVIAVGLAMLVPIVAFLLARRPLTFALAAAVVAVGRVFMTLSDPFVGVVGAALVVAGGGLYIAALARQLPARLAVALVLGLVVDQIMRAGGQTLDPTWHDSFLPVQTGLSAILFLIAVLRVLVRGESPFGAVPSYSGISLGGGVALGAILFLETALLGLPNAVAAWSGVDYSSIAPWLVAVTALTLVPPVRDGARRILTLVDVQWRGWFWLVIASLFVVIGNRFDGPVAVVALIFVQLLTVLNLWWIARPLGDHARDTSGLSVVVAFGTLALLFGADFFTYEYAFVRDFSGGMDWLSALLRSMRGLGLGVFIVGVALSAIPLMNARRRIPWMQGENREFLLGGLAVFASAAVVAVLALPPAVGAQENNERLRVASYNIHGGYSLYFDYDLAAIADTIWESGADVVLLQEVDAGRLVSYGVDQALWLGRRLGMTVHYFPTNEYMQGLAVLSRVPVVLTDGDLLTSQGMQTGVQRVQLRPDEGVLDVYNTWLGLLFAQDTDVLDTQEQDQYRQLQEVLGIISVDHPGGVMGRVVLGGTLNNTPESPLYQQLVDVGFSDPFDGMPIERSATLLRGASIITRFDYLWLRNILPTGRAVLESDASDHRLAIVELNLAQ